MQLYTTHTAYNGFYRVLLRLFLYQSTEQRMTLSPTHLQRDIDPQTLTNESALAKEEGWVGKRTGIRVQKMADCVQFTGEPKRHADVTDFLLSRRLTAEMLRKPDQMVAIQKNISKLGELLYILRPFLYGKLHNCRSVEFRLLIYIQYWLY